MISVEGGFVRTCCTGEGEFGIKRGNNGVLAGLDLFLAGIRDGAANNRFIGCLVALFLCKYKWS